MRILKGLLIALFVGVALTAGLVVTLAVGVVLALVYAVNRLLRPKSPQRRAEGTAAAAASASAPAPTPRAARGTGARADASYPAAKDDVIDVTATEVR